ncbi:hypothetical protein B0H16DRAFT_1419058, partial [Mycena metata]
MAKSRFSDISTCLNITRGTLELLADTLQISGLEAILNTTDSLTKLAETIKQNKDVCNKLMEETHQLLSAIVRVYIKSDTRGELPPSVLNHIAKFTQTLHKIHTFVEAQQGGNKVMKFFRQGELGSLLKDCKAELQQGLDFFQVTDIISEVKEMQEQAKARQQEVLDIIETLSISDSASSISRVYSSSYASSNSISLLPAEPKIFYGRDAELAHVLDLFTQESPRIAILGVGGMGKTSLARVVLHHDNITTRYGLNRFFVPCDGPTTKVELAGVIGAHLGLKPGKDLTRGVVRHLSRAPPTLLILDNLETLWDSAESRKEIEEFLSLLTDITSLALMITMRGAERPSKVRWTRPFSMPLQPLAQEAAQKMFFDIADDDYSMEEVNQVLGLTDNMPLAITLLAHLVDTEGCSEILLRWETEKTALLSEGYDKRNNLELSISLSLSSPRITSMPHCQDLLSLISLLPDGLSDVELKQIDFPIENILGCKSALLRTALAYADDHKRLKVLVPIREYMQRLLPSTDQMIRPLLKHFQELLKLFREHVGKQSGTLATSRITSNFLNIQSILRNSLHPGHPDLVASIYCTCYLNRFSMINGRGQMPLFDLISPMLPQLSNSELEFYVITETCRSWTQKSAPLPELINRAEELMNSFDDPNLKCNFYDSVARINLDYNGDIPMAIKNNQKVLSLAQSAGNYRKHCHALFRSSLIKWSLGEYSAGQAYAQEMQRLATIHGVLLEEASGMRLEVLNSRALGNYPHCISLTERAITLLALCGLAEGSEARVLMSGLGEVHMLKSEYGEAHNIHTQILQAAVERNDTYNQGHSLINIAEIEVAMGIAKHDIQKKIDAAKTIFKTHTMLLTACDCVQADLNLRE